ncbi:hypothetical protein G6F65_019277 [Rhizopus arrhizus]|nr:hypothetical protein G6F65_019277 [Rhizopus arrhizus]
MGATLRQEWQQSGAQAADRQQAISDALAQTVRDINAQAATQAGLLEGVSARMEAAANSVSDRWDAALSRQEQVGEKLATDNQQALTTAAAAFEQHAASLLRTLDQSHTDLQAAFAAREESRLTAWTDSLARTARDVTSQTEAQAQLLESVSTRLETAAARVSDQWNTALRP